MKSPIQIKKILSTAYIFFRELIWYCEHLIKRTSYKEYYALRMDRIVKRNNNWGRNQKKDFQLNYLKTKGLEPSSKILDYGCGAISAGKHFIKFLNKNNYYGVDISSEVVKEAKKRINSDKLASKSPNITLLKDGFFEQEILNQKFDFILAQSVFTHMPPEDIIFFLKSIRVMMHDKTKIFATFTFTKNRPRQNKFKDWQYPPEFFFDFAESIDLSAEILDDWMHPADKKNLDRMLLLTLK